MYLSGVYWVYLSSLIILTLFVGAPWGVYHHLIRLGSIPKLPFKTYSLCACFAVHSVVILRVVRLIGERSTASTWSTAASPVPRWTWLFFHWPLLPESQDHSEYSKISEGQVLQECQCLQQVRSDIRQGHCGVVSGLLCGAWEAAWLPCHEICWKHPHSARPAFLPFSAGSFYPRLRYHTTLFFFFEEASLFLLQICLLFCVCVVLSMVLNYCCCIMCCARVGVLCVVCMRLANVPVVRQRQQFRTIPSIIVFPESECIITSWYSCCMATASV